MHPIILCMRDPSPPPPSVFLLLERKQKTRRVENTPWNNQSKYCTCAFPRGKTTHAMKISKPVDPPFLLRTSPPALPLSKSIHHLCRVHTPEGFEMMEKPSQKGACQMNCTVQIWLSGNRRNDIPLFSVWSTYFWFSRRLWVVVSVYCCLTPAPPSRWKSDRTATFLWLKLSHTRSSSAWQFFGNLVPTNLQAMTHR